MSLNRILFLNYQASRIYNLNIMNPYSFSSEQEPHERHCLQQQLGSEQFGNWRGNSQQKEWQQDLDNGILSEFDMNMDHHQEIVQSFVKQNAISQETIQACIPAVQEQQKTEGSTKPNSNSEEKQIEQQVGKDQDGITFFEETNMSVTVARESVIEEKWRRESGEVLHQFLSMSHNIYDPLLSQFKAMLQKTEAYSTKSVANLDMYCFFFRIKLKQQQKRTELLKKDNEQIMQMINASTLLEGVYLNQKIVVNQMIKEVQLKLNTLLQFCQQIQESSNKIQLLFSKALQNRNKKIQQITTQIQRMLRIQQQLIQLISHPPLPESKDGWMGKADIQCDRYLQRKYLYEREQLFLSLLKSTGEKIVNLLNCLFIKEQPIIYSVITKQMNKYRTQSYKAYGNLLHSAQLLISKAGHTDFNAEINNTLAAIIPQSMKQNETATEGQALIASLNQHLQNQIFLPTIQLNAEHILFRAEAKWFAKKQHKINNQTGSQVHSHAKQNKQEWQASYSALVSTRDTQQEPTAAMAVTVVLTIDKYLHLECGDKIASLKLKKLKLSRKGNSIIIGDRNRSITTLFASSLNMGELQFTHAQNADVFISIVTKSK